MPKVKTCKDRCCDCLVAVIPIYTGEPMKLICELKMARPSTLDSCPKERKT